MIGLPGGKLFLLHDRDTLRDVVEASRVSRGCHHHGGNVGTSDEGILVWGQENRPTTYKHKSRPSQSGSSPTRDG